MSNSVQYRISLPTNGNKLNRIYRYLVIVLISPDNAMPKNKKYLKRTLAMIDTRASFQVKDKKKN